MNFKAKQQDLIKRIVDLGKAVAAMPPGPAREEAFVLLEQLREQVDPYSPIALDELKIRTKERTIINFDPNPIQRQYLDILCPDWQGQAYRFSGEREIILKARQFGFSTLILALYFIDTVTVPNTQTVVIAHDTDSTERIFQMVTRYYNHLPKGKQPRTRFANRREYLWPDIDSYFFVGTAGSGEFGRGGTINNVHGSEVAFWPDAQSIISGLLQSVPKEGNVILETTANGQNNWFYDEYQAAYHTGESVFKPRFWGWNLHPDYQLEAEEDEEPLVYTLEEESLAQRYDLTEAQIRWRRRKVLELREEFPQEYPINPDEAFLSTGGRVISEFIPEKAPRGHIVPDFVPPASWRHYLIIDPGWKRFACLFAAVDPEGRVWIYAEYYLGEKRPTEHMLALNEYWKAFGRPNYDVIMDSAGFDKMRVQTGDESPSWASELHLAAAELGAKWFNLRKSNKSDPLALRPKRYFVTGHMFVCESCVWFKWEIMRWTRQAPRTGRSAQEKRDPEAPIDRNNHLMDCLRYLTNELPEPLAVKPLPKSAIERHWERLKCRSADDRELDD